jgi:hypothetical protein
LQRLANAPDDNFFATIGRGRGCGLRNVGGWGLIGGRFLDWLGVRVRWNLRFLRKSRRANRTGSNGSQQSAAGRRERAIRLTHLGPLLHESFFFFCWALRTMMSSQLSMPVCANLHTNWPQDWYYTAFAALAGS